MQEDQQQSHSEKKSKISKANAIIIAALAVASFVTVFSLVSAKVLIQKYSYQKRVLSAQSATLNQISQDQTAAASLTNSYKKFYDASPNLLGGSPTGTGPQDGNNAKLILDALPDAYDFPALVTSVQNLLSSEGVSIGGIQGTDNSASPTAVVDNSPTDALTPIGSSVPMPFSYSVTGTYQDMFYVIATNLLSITPIEFQTININGDDSSLTMAVTAQSFYQPAITLNTSTETIK